MSTKLKLGGAKKGHELLKKKADALKKFHHEVMIKILEVRLKSDFRPRRTWVECTAMQCLHLPRLTLLTPELEISLRTSLRKCDRNPIFESIRVLTMWQEWFYQNFS